MKWPWTKQERKEPEHPICPVCGDKLRIEEDPFAQSYWAAWCGNKFCQIRPIVFGCTREKAIENLKKRSYAFVAMKFAKER